jgi:pimeloyl-ACP methyl ester carboxylesterase
MAEPVPDARTFTEVWAHRGEHRIRVRDYPGAEPAIVLMHGFPDNLQLYDRLLPHLGAFRRVVTFDFLGWGGSDKPAGYPYTAHNQTRDLDRRPSSCSTPTTGGRRGCDRRWRSSCTPHRSSETSPTS